MCLKCSVGRPCAACALVGVGVSIGHVEVREKIYEAGEDVHGAAVRLRQAGEVELADKAAALYAQIGEAYRARFGGAS